MTKEIYLSLDEISVGDYVDCGFVGIVGAIVKSLDGHTYIQLISPKAAAYGHPNNCDWLPFIDGMFKRVHSAQFDSDVRLYDGVIDRMVIERKKNLLVKVAECRKS
jgi:hypothetical protein